MDIPLLTPFLSIKSYLELFLQLVFPSLACPRCKEKEKIIKHGRYYRRAIDVDGSEYRIPIKRFRCKACRKTFSYLPPFLARYKPYCIQVVSPLIEAYLTTPQSLFHILYEKFPYSILEYLSAVAQAGRSLRLCLISLKAKAKIIYNLALKELLEINPLWDHQEDPRFLGTPTYLKKKALEAGERILELYRLFLIMEHYLAVAQAKFTPAELPVNPWLLLANQILFLNTYSTIF